MFAVTDQLQREMRFAKYPKRIISLVPSITELLFDLNLDDEVVGITRFCVRPQQWHQTKAKVGGTKNINIHVVTSLQPDLIIANKEENVKEQVETLQNIAPVFITDVFNLDDALKMIDSIGYITNTFKTARMIIENINSRFLNFSSPSHREELGMRACYLIWKNPYMTVGGDTFINDMIERCGFINVFKEYKRYPEISISQLSSLNCQLLMLSSEPFPFKQKHIDELQLLLPSIKLILVDGEMFSWYGSRLQHAPEYFSSLIKGLNDT